MKHPIPLFFVWLMYVAASGFAGFGMVALATMRNGSDITTAGLVGLFSAAAATLVVVAPILTLLTGTAVFVLGQLNDFYGLIFYACVPGTVVLLIYALSYLRPDASQHPVRTALIGAIGGAVATAILVPALG